MKRLFATLIISVIATGSLAALDAPQVDILNLRSKAMGGVRLSINDDQYAIMNNPAGTSTLERSWVSLIQAHIVFSGDFLSLYDHKDAFANIASGQADIDNSTWNYLSRMKLSLGTAPLYFTMLNILPFNINLAVFNSLNVRMKANPDIPIPTWDMTTYNDTVLVANFATEILDVKSIEMDLHFGVNAKVINRIQYRKDKMDLFYLYNLGSLNLEEMEIRRGLAFGMDLGFVATFGKQKDLKLSLTLSDFYSTRFAWTKPNNVSSLGDVIFGEGTDAGAAYIDPSLAIGASYRIGTLVPVFLENIVLALDIRDMFDPDINSFLKVYAGFEFEMLGFLKIRGGFYQGYVSAGLGIDVPILPIEIDFAYWAEEVGDYPGQDRLDNIGLTLNIVF
jgi:hypothetical protein